MKQHTETYRVRVASIFRGRDAHTNKQQGAKVLAIVVAAATLSIAIAVPAVAHDPSDVQQSYEVEVERTRDVPVYGWVTREVEVERTRDVPVYGWVTRDLQVERTRDVPVYGWVTRDLQVERTRDVPVYGWVTREVEVERTRDVPVYGWVTRSVPVIRTRTVPVYRETTRRFRVAPYSETYTLQPPCEWATVYGHRVYYCPPAQTRTRPVYNWATRTFHTLVGTRTETYTATESRRVYVQTGTRSETYTATESRRVYVQTGTRSETYTVTESRRVYEQTGTRLETYTVTESRRVYEQTGTRLETYTATESRQVYEQIGTRSETYTDTETRYLTVTRHEPDDHACPEGYRKPPLPAAWIELYTNRVTFSAPTNPLNYEPAVWERLDEQHDCHRPVLEEAESIDISEVVSGIVDSITNHVRETVENTTGEDSVFRPLFHPPRIEVLDNLFHVVLCRDHSLTIGGAAVSTAVLRKGLEKAKKAGPWIALASIVIVEECNALEE